jgi:hypothetical protein
MSNPDGFMIKNKLYKAVSIRTEVAMATYIEELLVEIDRLKASLKAIVANSDNNDE